MKRWTIPFLILLLAACSKIKEHPHEGYETHGELTFDAVNTELPVMNVELNPDTFALMYESYYTPLVAVAKLTLKRDQEIVIQDLEATVEIKGSHTAQFPLKSLGIVFEDSYDNTDRSLINPPKVLPFHNLDKIKACRLRTSGNDFYGTLIKDLTYTQLAIDAGLDIDLTYGEPVVVFVNQVFHGVMNLRTEGNTKGISRLYQTKNDHVSLAKIENPGAISFRNGDMDWLHAYVDAIKSGDLEYAMQHTDTANFIDYMIYQSFIANNDWPYNNVRFFSIDHQPFRFVMYDLDWCNTTYLGKDPEHFIYPTKTNVVSDLFRLLYSDAGFAARYDERYEEIVHLPELQPASFNAIVTSFAGRIKHEISLNIAKYGAPVGIIEWHRQVEMLKQNFAERYYQIAG